MKEPDVYLPLKESTCINHITDYYIGFKTISQVKGDNYWITASPYHNLVFMLEGEVELSYDNYLNHHFQNGELFFIPSGSNIYEEVIGDSKLLVLSFNNKIDGFCDNCTLHKYINHHNEIQYDFRPLKITPQIQMFIHLINEYIHAKILCPFLNELKQKELFVILPHNYTPKELAELFYPIICANLNFRTKIFEASKKGTDIHEIASKLGMSSRTFSRKFIQEFGEPARYWFQKQKAKSIKLNLMIPNICINDIIIKYEFTDMSHFSKFCKEHYGCTPAELLKHIKEEKSKK